MEKEKIIEEIKVLIASTKGDNIEINPSFLEYFQVEELIEIKEQLIVKKNKIRENTLEFLDEIYEKTKEN